MSDIDVIKARVVAFRDEREWKQFHNAKDLALQIAIEASELSAEFLWKEADEADRGRVQDELADVFISALLLAEHYGFSVADIVAAKLEKTALKYPVERARGRREKYTELGSVEVPMPTNAKTER